MFGKWIENEAIWLDFCIFSTNIKYSFPGAFETLHCFILKVIKITRNLIVSFSQAKGTASTHCGLLYNLFSYTMVHKSSASYILKDDSYQNLIIAPAVGPLVTWGFCDLGTKLYNKIMNTTQTCKIKDWDTTPEGNIDYIKFKSQSQMKKLGPGKWSDFIKVTE